MAAAGHREPEVRLDVVELEMGSSYRVIPGRLSFMVKEDSLESMRKMRNDPDFAKMAFFTSDFHTHFPVLETGDDFG